MKAIKVVALAVAALTLAGCTSLSWEEIAEHRDQCERLGGEYTHWQNEFGDHEWCDLDTEENA